MEANPHACGQREVGLPQESRFVGEQTRVVLNQRFIA